MGICQTKEDDRKELETSNRCEICHRKALLHPLLQIFEPFEVRPEFPRSHTYTLRAIQVCTDCYALKYPNKF